MPMIDPDRLASLLREYFPDHPMDCGRRSVVFEPAHPAVREIIIDIHSDEVHVRLSWGDFYVDREDAGIDDSISDGTDLIAKVLAAELREILEGRAVFRIPEYLFLEPEQRTWWRRLPFGRSRRCRWTGPVE